MFKCCLEKLRARKFRILFLMLVVLILWQYQFGMLVSQRIKTWKIHSVVSNDTTRRSTLFTNRNTVDSNATVSTAINSSFVSGRNIIYSSALDKSATTSRSPSASTSRSPKTITGDMKTFINYTRLKVDNCPVLAPNLGGRVAVSLVPRSYNDLHKQYHSVSPGGHWKPPNCKSRHRVAIIIPFRDRDEHLRIFLNHMHPFLQKQQLDYMIFVIEEIPGAVFNRAKLMNVGFAEANKTYDFQCFIFHDVDLLPEDLRNIYSCPDQPRHLSVAINKFNYKLPYVDIFGGACALKKEHFLKINGFSNKYWGWGGEDDDLAMRVKHAGYKITRYPVNIARYKMINHKGDTANPHRMQLLRGAAKRFHTDGISSLKYKLVSKRLFPLHTLIKVDIS